MNHHLFDLNGRPLLAELRLGRIGLALIIGLALLIPVSAAFSKEQSASISGTVEPGKTMTTRLGNLPEGADVSIRVDVSGEISIFLVDQHGFEELPALERPLFKGSTPDRLSFSILVPKTGSYFLIIDNRAGAEEREFTLAVTASANAGNASESSAKAQREFDKFEDNLRHFFVFGDLTFKVARCETENAFNDEDTVVLCAELGPRLRQTTSGEGQSRDVLFFILLHEIGHVLLRQWGYPFHDNEEIVDEFATVLLVMFNQSERARVQAEYFSKLSPEEELGLKRNLDDRHPLSVQRGRNIERWLDDPDLVEGWQKILVPHMQTAVLEALRESPKSWSNSDLIDKELASRAR